MRRSGEHRHEIPIAQPVGDVPADAQLDDLGIEAATSEPARHATSTRLNIGADISSCGNWSNCGRSAHGRAVSNRVTALPPSYFANRLRETQGGGASGSCLVSSNRHA